MSFEQKNVVITSAVRTAIGTFRGSLKEFQAHELGSFVAKEALKKSNLQMSDADELVMGQVLTGGAGQNPARQAAINMGMPNFKWNEIPLSKDVTIIFEPSFID